ncbi:MAG: serine/threonine-protein kinase, partial [Planctomycetes bacterium]|nr:serine/threonine-protein kinase [Planctomycetota bacterium]
MINTTIAHYKIIAKIGKGGMGEVYRATDTKLDREVAIKILPESFAGDRDRLARFNREAKALASLNHPNIAVIHGIEHHDDTHALVMELVEGETLGERLKREPMTVPEALDCCKQIAEALEAAHEKGIIHRDLKPENVKITSDGHVKVLDFGLAKVVVDPASIADEAESPTITHMTTVPGELLGTAPYMSPEQARAKPVDKRSDIWSFGCVLFECLTGKRMFQGEDVTETLATIIKGEPDWAALPENTPPTIHLLLRKCLNKDRKRRLRDIGDARIDLEQALGDPTSSIIRLSDRALQEAGKHSGINPLLAIGVMVLITLIAVALTWFLKPETPPPLPKPPPIRRISMDLGVEGNLDLRQGTAVRLSPDGSTLAYLFVPEGGVGRYKLYLRRLDQLEPTELTAAETANQFCFSPDGQWIAFRKDYERTLKKVSVTGGAAITLCETGTTRGIDWSDDGWIIFAPSPTSGLARVSSAAGGSPEPLTTLSDEEVTHRWPQALPGGHAVLYTARIGGSGFDEANIMVQRVPEGDPQLIWQGGYHARYLPSGHLVYLHQDTLFAAAFDLDSLTLRGQPSPVLEEVATATNERGGAHFDVSADGTLVYVRGSISESLYELEWVDRKGGRELLMPADRYASFKLSPDGRSLAYSLDDGEQRDIWIYDIERGVPTKLTFDPASDTFPAWSPSGESIVYRSNRDGNPNLYWKRSDGSGEAQRLTDSPNPQTPWSWHPEGRHLAIFEL